MRPIVSASVVFPVPGSPENAISFTNIPYTSSALALYPNPSAPFFSFFASLR
jgi:hypothetical protein